MVVAVTNYSLLCCRCRCRVDVLINFNVERQRFCRIRAIVKLSSYISRELSQRQDVFATRQMMRRRERERRESEGEGD